MKNSLWILFFSIGFFSSCQPYKKPENTKKKNTRYTINGTVFDIENKTVFLSIIDNNQIERTDSTRIKNNSFLFTGNIDYPKKAFIQIKNYNNFFPFIIANDSCNITLNTVQLQKSSIKNSPINDTLNKVKRESDLIFAQIDYLFPLLQKARIENNSNKLKSINEEIKLIDKKNNNYLYSFIEQHPDNYLSGLLLNDLWISTKKDSIRIKKIALKLSNKVKQTLNFAIH